MTADQYLHSILLREAVDAGPKSPLLALQATLMPTLRQWAGGNLLGVYPSPTEPSPARGQTAFPRAPHDKATTCFLLELITRLQRIGTAPPIDMAAYARWLVPETV